MIVFDKRGATPVQYDVLKKSSIGSGSLEDLTWSIPMPAHIKDATNGKYIISNQKNLEVYGLSKAEDIIGKTILDLDMFMRPHWGENFAKRVFDLDLQIKQTSQQTMIQNQLLVSSDGFIHLQDMTKIPITRNKKVTSIFTHTYDKTHKLELIDLFKIYTKFYKRQNDAVKIFGDYLGINSFLIDPLSLAELKLMLYAKNCSSRKELAEKMHRSIKTIETHITHINSKLKIGEFLMLLGLVRSREKPKQIINEESLWM